MISSLRLTALMLGVGIYLCLGLLFAGLFFLGSYFYPFTFSAHDPVMFIGGQVVRTAIIALGAYYVAKKSAPVSLFNVLVYALIVIVAVLIVSLFNPESFLLERLLSMVGALAGSYLGYSFFKDGQREIILSEKADE